ncbi:hypothetical protein [Streptomyces sp. H27-D2]|uniref:hypothetical protein n=1 Tax=Streptomyces sp. H27-D2 TaxID=3046304 RepID=UPI002DBF12D1|nr:hypothetical protein [Streptomyces sp. H27-D2]MEC4019732.1 hypothetical protein [Streptomyces sp. H27-D2]
MAAARTVPRPAAPLVAALALAASLLACGPGAGSKPAAGPSPATTSPQDLCTRLIVHWANDQLRPDGGDGGDYQEFGLSDGQNNILIDVLAHAKTERKDHGPAAARELIKREAKQRCESRYASRGASPAPAGGWPT